MKKKTKSALGSGGNRRSNILIMLLLAALIVTTLPLTSPVTMTAQAISDCDNHSWGAWEVTIEPTCIAWGTRVRRCENCFTEETEDLRPTGQHRFEVTPLTQETPATCTQAGSRTLYCGVCGESKEEKIPALDHAWDGGTVTKEAGCTEAGVKTFKCTRCNESRTEAIAATGHNYQTTVTKEASCTEEGEKETKCTLCGDIKKEAIPKIAHQYQEAVTKEATCTADGVKTTKCTLCGETKTEAIPKLGHNYQETVTKQPTCTEEGEKETKCTRCNDSKTEKIAALGHDWDRSETKEPEGFTDGEAVAKCRRCGETETQPIYAGAALLNKLRNGGKATTRDNTDKYDPLKIVEQTTGEFFIHHGTDESVTLSVKAEGGVEPYSYTWHAVPNGTADYANHIVYKDNSRKVQDYLVNYTGSATAGRSKALQAYRKRPGRAKRPQRQRIPSSFVIGGGLNKGSGKIIYRNAEAQHHATRGGYNWYCVVKDAVGNEVMSENIPLFYYPYIAESPFNVNLHNGPATTTFRVSGGTESCVYEWHNWEDGTPVGEPQTHGSITLDKPGEYYCQAINKDLNEPLRSHIIIAYDAEPLTVQAAQEEYEFDPAKDEPVTMTFSCRGGVPPYRVQYFVNGNLKQDYMLEASGETFEELSFAVSERELDIDRHVVSVSDKYADLTGAVSTVVAPRIHIRKQPAGGYLDSSNKYKLSVEVEKGVEISSLEYILCDAETGKGLEVKATNSHACSFDVSRSGRYYIEAAERSSGRWVRSDTVVVQDNTLRITFQTPDQVKDDSRDTTTLMVRPEGGTPPYRARWEVKPILPGGSYADSYYTVVPGGWSEKVGMLNHMFYYSVCNTQGQGIFRCTVTDAKGKVAAAEIKVESKGQEPRIIQQPENVTIYRDENGNYPSARLVCIAESVTGDNSGLSYTWQKEGLHHGGHMTFFGGYGTGPVLHLSGDDIDGVYKCWVYDSKTYEGVDSFKVEVKSVTPCEITKVSLYKNIYRTKTSPEANIRFEINGLRGPYTVEFFEKMTPGNPRGEYGEYRRLGKKSYYGGYPSYLYTGDSYLGSDVRWDGYARKWVANADVDYYLVVYDADGQRFQSEKFALR